MARLLELHNQILSDVEVNVALLDADGISVDVSESWIEFARANGGSLDSLGVGTNYLDVCHRFAELTVECRIGDVPRDLDRAVVVSLYRVSQEALRNIAKHAQATNVTVDSSASQREVRLPINDNGAGFDVAAARYARGLGLASMSERLKLVGGTLEVDSRAGEGTRIEAIVPLVRRL